MERMVFEVEASYFSSDLDGEILSEKKKRVFFFSLRTFKCLRNTNKVETNEAKI